jgi:hypothetical protein
MIFTPSFTSLLLTPRCTKAAQSNPSMAYRFTVPSGFHSVAVSLLILLVRNNPYYCRSHQGRSGRYSCEKCDHKVSSRRPVLVSSLTPTQPWVCCFWTAGNWCPAPQARGWSVKPQPREIRRWVGGCSRCAWGVKSTCAILLRLLPTPRELLRRELANRFNVAIKHSTLQ